MKIANKDLHDFLQSLHHKLKKFHPGNSMAEFLGLVYGATNSGDEDFLVKLIEIYLESSNSKISQEILLAANYLYNHFNNLNYEDASVNELIKLSVTLLLQDNPDFLQSTRTIDSYSDFVEAYNFSLQYLARHDQIDSDSELEELNNAFNKIYSDLSGLVEAFDILKQHIFNLLEKHKTSIIGKQIITVDGLEAHHELFQDDEYENLAYEFIVGEVDFIAVIYSVYDLIDQFFATEKEDTPDNNH